MGPIHESAVLLTRRHFFGRSAAGVGVAALASLLAEDLPAAGPPMNLYPDAMPGLPHFKATAKRVIYLFQSGAPSQMDLFDHKPKLAEMRGKELPDSIRKGQRLTGMTATQASFPLAPSKFRFARHGKSQAWVSELLPHTAKVADRLVLREVDVHRGDQSRSGDHLFPDRRADRRPAEHGRVAELWPGQQQQELAGFRGAGVARQRQSQRPAVIRSPVGQRLLALEVSGREVSLRWRPGAVPGQP